MALQDQIKEIVKKGLSKLYSFEAEDKLIQVQKTLPDFDGELTVVVFPFLRFSKKNPIETGNDLGAYLVEHCEEVEAFNVVKGFLNLCISDAYYINLLHDLSFEIPSTGKTVMVEYSSPNTNKPLHLGHVRNNTLGYSVAKILEANGNKVLKTQIINDRGIHICKSMLSWKKYAGGATPESEGMKGDHFVGKYYVEFDKHYKEEMAPLMEQGMSKEEAMQEAPSFKEAQEMLRKWEEGDEETVSLWKTMNQWVYDGFESTYSTMGVDFDKLYYESDTYLLGKKVVEEGIKKGVFYQREDGSVWCDLTDEGLDEKLVLRKDGTAVYMTQDIGTAIERDKDFNIDGMIYTVGNEQEYHFKVLFLILKKLGYGFWEGLYHLSYGMVELPSGKMKTREGTVVDADDLMAEMISTAAKATEEKGKLDGYSQEEIDEINKKVGLAALKYFILKVDPRKGMVFNPEESIDFNGNTGPFILFNYVRTKSILRKYEGNPSIDIEDLNDKEKSLIIKLTDYISTLKLAGKEHSPAIVANYCYELAKEYSQFYAANSILNEENTQRRDFRVALSQKVGDTLEKGMGLLGIQMPERM